MEIFVCGGCFIAGVFAAITEHIVCCQRCFDICLAESLLGLATTHAASGTVIDTVGGVFSTGKGDHDGGTIAGVSGQQDGVSGIGEWGALQFGVSGGESTCGAFAVDPQQLVIDPFLSRDIMANEIDQGSAGCGQDGLERFEYQRVDQQVVDRGEVRTERHVFEVGIGFGRPVFGVDKMSITEGESGACFLEAFLERFELLGSETVSETAGTAVAEETDVVVAQPERCGRLLCEGCVADVDDFAFTEVVATSVAAELGCFFTEAADAILIDQSFQASGQAIDRAIGRAVICVFAALGPIDGDAELFEHAFGSAFGGRGESQSFINLSAFGDMARTATGAGGNASIDFTDELASDAMIVDRFGR